MISINPSYAQGGGQVSVSRPASARVAILGGSMGAYNITQSGNALDLDSRGILTAAAMRGVDMQLTLFAVAGSTAQAMYETQLPQLAPGAYDYVAVLIGGNDVLAQIDHDTTTSYIDLTVRAIVASGATPLLFTPPPYSATAFNSTQVRLLQRLSKWLLTYPARTGIGFVFDVAPTLLNRTSASGAYKSGLTYDAIHPCWSGADAVAAQVDGWLRNVVGLPARQMRLQSILDTWTYAGAAGGEGINLCDPGVSMMQGSSGTTGNLGAQSCSFSGSSPGASAADRWQIYANALTTAGMACTLSTATDADGTPYLQLAVTYSAAGQYIALVAQNLASRATDGRYYDSEAHVQVIGGTVRPCEVVLMTSAAADQSVRAAVGTNAIAIATLNAAGASGINADASYLLHTPRLRYLAAYGVLQPVIRLTALAAGTCTYRIKQVDCREYLAA